MSPDGTAIATFLAAAGWSEARRMALGADWSTRRYERVTLGPRTAILMDSPPDQPVGPFVQVAAWLRSIGLHAPAILAGDEAAGLLLLEDFGDRLLARAIGEGADEAALYDLAVEALLRMQEATPPAWLPMLDAAGLLRLLDLFLEHAAPAGDAACFRAAWAWALETTPLGPARFLYRDYHAENLMLLADGPGLSSLGLLDFQDAHRGPRAYDLVSLVQDARRDVAPAVACRCVERFRSACGLDAETMDLQVAVLGAQRAMRILGVVARLEARGRAFPASLVERVRGHLGVSLTHPALAGLRAWCAAHYPAGLPAG